MWWREHGVMRVEMSGFPEAWVQNPLRSTSAAVCQPMQATKPTRFRVWERVLLLKERAAKPHLIRGL